MRLNRVWIDSFKNLRNVQVEFDNNSSPYTVIVGENGSGKSNFLEAVTTIFRNLDLGENTSFAYDMEYECRGKTVTIQSKSGKSPKVTVTTPGRREQRLSRSEFLSEDGRGPIYRPAFVFGYYSGPSGRLQELFQKHRDRYYADLIKPEALRKYRENPNERRRLFYAETVHGQFALLAFFMQDDVQARDFLREHLLIDAFDSVLFNLRQPSWRPREGGDPVFWHAEGEVRLFLNRLLNASLAPLNFRSRMGSSTGKLVDTWHLFLAGGKSLQEVYRSYRNQYGFFTALESLLISDVIADVRVRVRLTPGGGNNEVTYRDLSEGEQQLLLVLGLLKFTAKDETLFILDEPDTHLNPLWGTQYLRYLDQFIERRENCHILMTTHDPLLFAGLTREDVRIFKRSKAGETTVAPPLHDPRGMGVAAILTSDLFRLRTTLDPDTQGKLDKQRQLAVKTDRSSEEQQLFENLSSELERLQLQQETRDPLYKEFVQAWARAEDPTWNSDVEVGSDERKAREILADRVVEQLRLDFPDGV